MTLPKTLDALKATLMPLFPTDTATAGIAVQKGAVAPLLLESLATTAAAETCAVTIVGTAVGAAAAVAAAALAAAQHSSATPPITAMIVWAPASPTEEPPTNLGPSWGPVDLHLDDDGELRHLRAWSRTFVLHVTHGGVSPRQLQLGAAIKAALPPAVGMVTRAVHAVDPAVIAAASVVVVANATAVPAAVYPMHVLASVLQHVLPSITAVVCELCPHSLYMLDMLTTVVKAVGADVTAALVGHLPSQVRIKVQQARPLLLPDRNVPDLDTLRAQLALGPLRPPTDHGAAVPRIALVMIVRDESALIQRCVRAVWPYVDAYCILDTGSVDDTQVRFQEVVAGGVAPKPGAYIFGSWRGFGASRSEALALGRAVHAPGVQWLLMIDADDIFNGVPGTWLPCKPDTAAHELSVRFGADGVNATSRVQVFSRAHSWVYRGILHEYAFLPHEVSTSAASEASVSAASAAGDPAVAPPAEDPTRAMGPHLPPTFFIDARTEGYRSRNPTKYRDDALALEAALAGGCDEMDRHRYTFYLAQSWRDAGETPRALEVYRTVATTQGAWTEERYGACMNLVELGPLATPEDLAALMPWVWLSIELNPLRREVVVVCMARARLGAVKPSRQLYAAALHVNAHASPHCLSNFVFGRVQAYSPEVWRAELNHVAAAFGYPCS
jgi:hypothetical protein